MLCASVLGRTLDDHAVARLDDPRHGLQRRLAIDGPGGGVNGHGGDWLALVWGGRLLTSRVGQRRRGATWPSQDHTHTCTHARIDPEHQDSLAPVPLQVRLLWALDVAGDVAHVERRRRIPAPLLLGVRAAACATAGDRCGSAERGRRSAGRAEQEGPAAAAPEHPWTGGCYAFGRGRCVSGGGRRGPSG